jgi:hypothetical protein
MERIIYDIINTNIIKLFEKPTIFFPSNKFDIETNVNAIIKFLLYSSVIILFLTNNWKLPVVIIIFIIIFQIISKKSINVNNEMIEKNHINHKCRKSTVDNPMGNVLLYTPINELNYKACPDQTDNMDKNIKNNIYFDSKDLFLKKNNIRPFITMPSQVHPNDINAYKTYLYNFEAPTCKTNGLNCMFTNDLRYNKNSFLDK